MFILQSECCSFKLSLLYFRASAIWDSASSGTSTMWLAMLATPAAKRVKAIAFLPTPEQREVVAAKIYTPAAFSVVDCIRPGIKYPACGSSIAGLTTGSSFQPYSGIACPDVRCYTVFAALTNPLIEAIHRRGREREAVALAHPANSSPEDLPSRLHAVTILPGTPAQHPSRCGSSCTSVLFCMDTVTPSCAMIVAALHDCALPHWRWQPSKCRVCALPTRLK